MTSFQTSAAFFVFMVHIGAAFPAWFGLAPSSAPSDDVGKDGEGAVDATSGLKLFTVPLDKQYVPVIRNNRTVMYKTAYFGSIYVGLPSPQLFTVVFDTGSGHFFVPADGCVSESCKTHRVYSHHKSGSGTPLDHDAREVAPDSERDQVAIAFGTGEIVGEFARETVCLNNHSGDESAVVLKDGGAGDCASLRVIFATEMSPEPFRSFTFDGVLGLGLETLAIEPEFSFFGQLSKTRPVLPLFGVFISPSDAAPSEISFGGADARRMAEEMRWAPVHRPDLGYWQLAIKHVLVAGEVLDICEDGACVAIADTGTSLVGAPRKLIQHLHWLLARKVEGSLSEVDCREHPGPEIVFDLGGVQLRLGPEDYSRPAALRVVSNQTKEEQLVCRASLLPVDEAPALGPKAWILGEPLLRKYYTAYDWAQRRVGFARAVHTEAGDSKHQVVGAPPSQAPSPTVVHV